jgi:hypothetical protein
MLGAKNVIKISNIIVLTISALLTSPAVQVTIEVQYRMSSTVRSTEMARSTKRKEEAQAAPVVEKKMSKSDLAVDEATLTPEQEQELAEVTERIVALGRRSTAQTYEYGEELAKAQAILPPKKFGKWLKANCGITTKTAKNYTRVYKELAEHRVRLEKAAAAPAAMFALFGATDDAIENVLSAYEKGERPTVAAIKEMVGGAGKAETLEVDILNMPGRAGCLKIAEQRMKSNIALFFDLLAKILIPVEKAAVKFESGVRVIKADLIAAIEIDCRHANDVFGLTLAPLFMNFIDPRFNWRSSDCEPMSAWGRLQRALLTAGGRDSWPTGEAFKPWIVEEVYPLLKFAVRGEPLDIEHTSDGAKEAADIRAQEEARDLKATRMRFDDAPGLQPDNVVVLASRQKTTAGEAAEA